MDIYSDNEQLKLTHKVYITKEVFDILVKEKRRQKISKAKIVCNLIIKEYGHDTIYNSRGISEEDSRTTRKYPAQTKEVKTNKNRNLNNAGVSKKIRK